MAGVVGREAELRALDALLGGDRPEPRALFLAGEAGIGKTTVWDAGVEMTRARGPGFQVLAARPAESEQELPYAALGDLLETVSDEEVRRLAEPQSAAIEAVLARASSAGPSICTRCREACWSSCAASPARTACSWRSTTSSGSIVRQRRCSSSPSAGCGRPRCAVLVAARTEAGSTAALPLGLDDWGSALQRVEIGPLSATQLGSLLASALGTQLSPGRSSRSSRASRAGIPCSPSSSRVPARSTARR